MTTGGMKQVGLLAAGCQPWNSDVCAASADRFAYCATLAIYVYQLDHKFSEYKLHSIMSEHKKTITAIAWNPRNPDIFASASADNRVIVWNVAEQRVVANLENTKQTPSCLGWCMHERDAIAFIYARGPLCIWNFGQNGGLTTHKEASNFISDVCQFRWHHRKIGKMAFGHVDGTLSIFTPGQKGYKHTLRPENLEGSDEEDPVADLQWDPLSSDYLLVSNQHFGVRLVDTDSMTVIMSFILPSAAASVHTLSWIPTAPGMFVTGDTHVGVMRVWNVSKSTPIENIKLKRTGFHALHVINSSLSNNNSDTPTPPSPTHTSSTSMAPSTSSNNAVTVSGYSIPPGHAVCTFLDGGVGLYDLGKRKWNFLRDLGHVETIFDCKFKPDNPELLATASFDGTIKVWDVNTLTAVFTSPGNEGVIYALSWAPADLNCIAAATSRHGAFLWDVTKGKIIKRFNEHGKFSIYSIAWNHKDSRRIATCGSDGHCIIRNVDGKIIQKYKHPAAVFGCDWSTNNKDMIATGCEDGNVRVYYIATTSDQPLKVFTGHTAKVFHVKWSPLREGILCSGSDDGTIRIWDYTQDACINVLAGHSGPVRGLLWNPEIPFLLISGSWDYTIRVWDIRDGACIDTVLDHGADVYGLTTHPKKPLTVASCSRDSTVRIWTLAPLVTTLQMKLIAKRPLTEIVSTPEHASAVGVTPLLAGKNSRDLKQALEKLSSDNAHAVKLKLFSEFFSPPGGAKNLWELVDIVNGQDTNMTTDYKKGVLHMKHLTKYKASGAQELEIVKMSRFGAGIGAQSKEERLREAAQIHIRLGNIQRYCELMVELGEWNKALSVAPGVSYEYWKQLTERHADCLMKEDNDACIPYCVATGQAAKLVDYHSGHGQFQEAMLVAQVACEGSLRPPYTAYRPDGKCNGLEEPLPDYNKILHKCSEELADWYFQAGSPVLAACCHLSVENAKLAMSKLIRGNELELAISTGSTLKTKDHRALTSFATELLARRCERISRCFPSSEYRDLAIDLLKTIPDCDLPLIRMCARCTGSSAEINDLHQKAGLASLEDSLKFAKEADDQGNTLEAVKYYILSPNPESALDIGLAEIKSKMSASKWQVEEVKPLLDLLSSIRTEKLQQQKCSKQRNELLAISAYIGALVALRREYDSIVPALFEHSKLLCTRDLVAVPFTEKQVVSELEAWRIIKQLNNKSSSRENSTPKEEHRVICESLLKKAGPESSDVDVGPDLVSGSHLPSHSDVHVSYLTGNRIQGPAFFLEDGRQAISLNDALMWAKVNPFSPLGTGAQINPF
ncbi:WD repeat-containing protein 17-like isoform X2 [Ptychodera flava]|uniref:WD repeat-containing protein 17-like isoform X2 n=1 Tax=Ptychodera flava TaxID=63121 RepID=UPI00396A5EC3